MLLVIVALLQLSAFSISPKSNNVWVFASHACLDFNSGNPVCISGKPLFTYDNSASICDDQGNLLFYTNGETVWDRRDSIMQNGTGLFGSVTGGQTAVIVPVPDNEGRYYIFTVPEFGSGGMYYSIVELNQNGGYGAITSKNNILINSSTEKLIAYFDYVNFSFWIIAHEYSTANFYCYKVDNNGLDTIPVISNVGAPNSGGSYGYDHGAMGQLAITKDGAHLANALEYDGKIQLFDFDLQTGIISNPLTLTNYSNAWGLAFSPDGSKLYSTQWTYSAVYQWDLTNYSQTAIQSSKYLIGNASGSGGYNAGYMQLAPDGKIYISRVYLSTLATISSPNSAGTACNYNASGLPLTSGSLIAGMNNSINFSDQFIGIDEVNEKAQELIIFPNPSSEYVMFKNPFGINEEFKVGVYDNTGKLLKAQINLFNDEYRIDVSKLPKGIYFTTVMSKGKKAIGKFIVE